jgi:hypothetical protein
MHPRELHKPTHNAIEFDQKWHTDGDATRLSEYRFRIYMSSDIAQFATDFIAIVNHFFGETKGEMRNKFLFHPFHLSRGLYLDKIQ